ncbi:MAG TPA: acylneuraminate cytidylyltransferase [Anaerolineaceae bacterium]|nr:acylneuraminate cytidylyltransferase [Anaerolineaceae bacterium]
MVKPAEVLAIIPARGGSKGIPHKNIKLFAGYPLISYSIAAGLQAGSVTRVIVSTDDEEIAEVARAWGAETPFLRPAELAQDKTTDLPVFQHALTWLKQQENYTPDLVIQLRPTSPIRPRNCVEEAVSLLQRNPTVDSVRGVVPSGQNPYKMWRLNGKDEPMTPLLTLPGVKEPYNAPRQVLPPTYWQTGHIDVIRPQVILEKNSMSGDSILPYEIDPRYTVDIDTPFDWLRYEWLVRNGDLDMVDPASRRRKLPAKTSLVVMDFDGVLTDNLVHIDEQGNEQVSSSRGDSMGLRLVRETLPIDFMVISTEVNPVVAARCKKLKLEYFQGIDDKPSVLRKVIREKGIPAEEIVFIGNDVNDIGCMEIAGYAVAPADAEAIVKRHADLVLTRKGGKGAVRDFCDILLQHYQQ